MANRVNQIKKDVILQIIEKVREAKNRLGLKDLIMVSMKKKN